MNTNPSAKTVLCFGDSNTWGRTPDRIGRYASDVRWPGVVQDILGPNYYVIEEGLGGRTIDLESPNGSGRNGKVYFSPCFTSHSPVDILIIMLGTNDLKKHYKTNAITIKSSLSSLIDDAQTLDETGALKIIVVSPIHIVADAPRFKEFYSEDFDGGAGDESKRVSTAIKTLCDQRKISYIDASICARAGEDGLHLDLESCKNLSLEIAKKILTLA